MHKYQVLDFPSSMHLTCPRLNLRTFPSNRYQAFPKLGRMGGGMAEKFRQEMMLMERLKRKLKMRKQMMRLQPSKPLIKLQLRT